MGYIDQQGVYYEGNKQFGDTEVPNRPSLDYTWNGSAWVVNTSVTWAAYQVQAQALLDKSDLTILRCYENSVAVPTEWAAYRKALRAIIKATSGDATIALPVTPAYPTGT